MPPPYPTMLLRRFRSSGFGADDPFGVEDDYFGGEDPFAALEARLARDAPPPAPPTGDEQVLSETYRWVDAVIVKMKVCPFSSSVERAGLPAGGVSYPICHAICVEQLYQAFWEQVEELRQTDERTLSTVLLVAPKFATAASEGSVAHARFARAAPRRHRGLDSGRETAARRPPTCSSLTPAGSTHSPTP